MTSDNPVQAMLDQLKNEFIAELPSRLEEIEALVLGLSSNNNYEEIYRLIHSLKGAGGTHGIQIISVVCHQLESYLESQHDSGSLNSSQCIDHCLKYIDLLVKTHEEASKQKPQFNKIEKLLNEISDQQAAHRYTTLILESSRLQFDLIKQSLAHLPLIIDSDSNGLKALELLLHKKYDIIITGMEISELNGEALISAMRLSKSVNKDTKSILLTSKRFNNPNRATDPDRIITRSTKLSNELEKAVTELLDINRN